MKKEKLIETVLYQAVQHGTAELTPTSILEVMVQHESFAIALWEKERGHYFIRRYNRFGILLVASLASLVLAIVFFSHLSLVIVLLALIICSIEICYCAYILCRDISREGKCWQAERAYKEAKGMIRY